MLPWLDAKDAHRSAASSRTCVAYACCTSVTTRSTAKRGSPAAPFQPSRKRAPKLGVVFGDPLGDVAGDQGDVLAAVAERGDIDAQADAGEELGLQAIELAIRGPEQAKVRATSARVAEALVLALVEHAKQVRLKLERQLGNLVEEERRAVGLADQPGALGHPHVGVVGDVAEELRVDEAGRDGRRVARDELPRATRRGRVNRPGNQLLAGAALAGDEDVRGARADERDAIAKRPGGGALTDDPQRVCFAEGRGHHHARSVQRGRDALRSSHAEEGEEALQLEDVSLAHDQVRDLRIAVDDRSPADALDVDGIALGTNAERPPREVDARNLRDLDDDPGALADGVDERLAPAVVCVAAPEDDRGAAPRARRKGEDLAHTRRLVARPEHGEGQAGLGARRLPVVGGGLVERRRRRHGPL